jgi:hypothetical protein
VSQSRELLLIHRLLVIIALNALVLIHLLDLPSKVEETPYLAVGYVLLISVAILLMQALISHESTVLFALAAGVGCTVAGAFVLTRTVGLPGATGDIGNWTEPLGLASLVVDVQLVLQSGFALFLRVQPHNVMQVSSERSVQEIVR